MGCNCGKKAEPAGFVYVNEQGAVSQPTTNVQALAMKARNGGKGSVRPA